MTTFAKGEHIVYAQNGICVIDDIRREKMAYAPLPKKYYILRPLHSPSSVLYVPVDNDELVSRMRYVLTAAEIDEMLASVKGKEMEWDTDRKARMAYFKELSIRGDRADLLLMIRCIYQHGCEIQESKKRLSGSDEDFLAAAQRAVNEEFSFALGIPAEEVGPYIRHALGIDEDCF